MRESGDAAHATDTKENTHALRGCSVVVRCLGVSGSADLRARVHFVGW